MPTRRIRVTQHECARCGHVWVPRGKERPMICPKCKSAYWDRARQDKDK